MDCDTERGKDVKEELGILRFLTKKSAPIIAKIVKSAAANAENNYDLDPGDLYVKRIYADDGPTIKRYRAGARGRAKPILKRSCHITVIVDERDAE